jgi:Carboxypeptidase regulatory-like domain
MKANWKIALMTVLSVAIAAPAFAAAVCGVARNAQNQPIAGLPVTCKDSSGNVLGQATTDADGRYVITGLPQGTVDIFLEAGGTTYKAGSGVLNLTEASADVNWEVSPASAALAAQSGMCDAAGAPWTGWETASVAALGIAGAAAVGITVWALTSDLHDRHHHPPTSPSF